jgi:two-component system OmpR family sensor kinase
MSSLRARLFVALVAVVILAGLVSGLAIYWWAYGEAIELQDGLIVQIGSFLAERPARPDPIPSEAVDPDVQVSVAELDEAPSIDPPPLALVPREIADGLHTLDLHGKTWRVFVQTRRDGSRMVVGQPAEARDEIMREGAAHAAVSFAALIPCLMVLIAWSSTTAFAQFRFSPKNWTAKATGRRRDFRTRVFRMSSDHSFWPSTASSDDLRTGSIASAAL